MLREIDSELFGAVMDGHTETAERLIKAGADVNAKNQERKTALDYALKRGNAGMIDLIKKSITLRQKAEEPEKREKIHKLIAKSLFGMVGLETFSKQLSIDLHDFIEGSGSQGRIFWRNSGTGKIEFAQRIAGMKDGIPTLVTASI